VFDNIVFDADEANKPQSRLICQTEIRIKPMLKIKFKDGVQAKQKVNRLNQRVKFMN